MTALVTQPRSPFYTLDEQVPLGLLVACGAKVIETPTHSEDLHEDVEGYVLFRESMPFTRLYIPVNGILVFFGSPGAICDKERLKALGIKALLLEGHQYRSTIGPGQIAGMLEFLACYMDAVSKVRGRSADQKRRRESLEKAYLLDPSYG